MKTKLVGIFIALFIFAVNTLADVPIKLDLALGSNVVKTFSQTNYDIGKGQQPDKNYLQITDDLYDVAQLIINNPDRVYVIKVTGITDNETYSEKYTTINEVLNYALGLWRIHDFTQKFKPLLSKDTVHNYVIIPNSEHDTTLIDGKLRNFSIEVLEISLNGSAILDPILLKPDVLSWLDEQIESIPKLPKTVVNPNFKIGVGVTSGILSEAVFGQFDMNFNRWTISMFGGFQPSSDISRDARVDTNVDSRSRFGGFSLNYLLIPKANIYLGVGYEWYENRFHSDHRTFEDADDFTAHLGWLWTKQNIFISGTYMHAPIYEMERGSIERSDEFRVSAVLLFNLNQLIHWGK